MKTCISTYSFSRLIGHNGFTHIEALDKTKELGADATELVLDDNPPDGSDPRTFARRLCEHAREIGLPVAIYTTGANFLCADTEAEIERLKTHIDIASELGIPLLRHDVAYGFGDGYTGVPTFEAALPQIAQAVRIVAEYAQNRGVMTCSENHGLLAQDSTRMLALFTAVNHPNYRYLCDIGNFSCVDEDCAVAVGRLLPLIAHVHAKDMFVRSGMLPDPGEGWMRTRAGNFLRPTILGHGSLPSQQTLGAIARSGYDGYVSLEFEGMEDVLPAIRIGLDNLKRCL